MEAETRLVLLVAHLLPVEAVAAIEPSFAAATPVAMPRLPVAGPALLPADPAMGHTVVHLLSVEVEGLLLHEAMTEILHRSGDLRLDIETNPSPPLPMVSEEMTDP